MNVEVQLTYKNLLTKLFMRFPEFHSQHSLELSALYIPLHNLDNYKCNLMVLFLFRII